MAALAHRPLLPCSLSTWEPEGPCLEAWPSSALRNLGHLLRDPTGTESGGITRTLPDPHWPPIASWIFWMA